MKTYTFQYYYSTGHGGANGSVNVCLNDDQAEQLERFMNAGNRTLQYSTETRSLYDRVIGKIAIHEIQGYNTDYLLEFAEEDDDDPETCMEYYLQACNLDIFLPGVEWDS